MRKIIVPKSNELTAVVHLIKCQVFVIHFTRQKGVGWEDLSGFGIQESGSDTICRMFAMVPNRVTENKVDLFMWPRL